MDDAAELVFEIDGIEGDFQPLGNAAGIVRVAGAAAALFLPGITARATGACGAGIRFLVAVAHEEPYHVVTGLAEQPGRHAAIDSTGHG
jgi:hypothetical protein